MEDRSAYIESAFRPFSKSIRFARIAQGDHQWSFSSQTGRQKAGQRREKDEVRCQEDEEKNKAEEASKEIEEAIFAL